jgi:AraC-like DNA-binding protein
VESNARSLQFGFQACFACTVYEYVKRRKLELAKVILATTGDTMNEVADQVGYNDGPYLINAFRTAFGMTPEEYRKEAQKRKSN